MSDTHVQQNEASLTGVRDEVRLEGKWNFDDDVTLAFEDMLQRSIPAFAQMRELCFDLGCRFVRDKTCILDLGCSRGGAMAPFVDRCGATVQHVGVEVSPPMLAACRERFKGFIDCGVVQVRDDDLRKTYPPVRASLTLCVLTLQFVPIEHRQRIVRRMWEHTLPGGAVILVEKVLGSCHETDELLTSAYWDLKVANGYGRDDVERKRASLEGVLVPVTAGWNEELLRSAGFRQVERFWQILNFCGWIAVKDS